MIPYAQKSQLLRACDAVHRRQARIARRERIESALIEAVAWAVSGLAIVGAVALVRWAMGG